MRTILTEQSMLIFVCLLTNVLLIQSAEDELVHEPHVHHNQNRAHHRRSHHQLDENKNKPRHSFKSNKLRNLIENENALINENDLQRDYVSTTIGKDIQIDCKMKDVQNEDEKIVWLKMPKGEVLSLNGNRVTQDHRISTKCINNLMPCWSLLIKNTKESDSGFYVCQTNAMQTKYVYLDIMVPPKLLTKYPLDRIDVNHSMNMTITCEFYGKPEPLVKWYKYQSGKAREMEKFRGFKTIDLFINKDSPSEYECVADNSIPPTVSKKIFLNIQYAPQIKFLNNKVYQKRGERVIFDCHVNSNPHAQVVWYRNQTQIEDSSKYRLENLPNFYYRLYINNINEKDFGDYYCTASNTFGQSTSKIELIELTVASNEPSRLTTTTTTTSTTPPSTTTKLTNKNDDIAKAKLNVKPKPKPKQIETSSNDKDYSPSNERSQDGQGVNMNKNLIFIKDDYAIKSDVDDDDDDDDLLRTTTRRYRTGKLPSYRSNKFNQSRTSSQNLNRKYQLQQQQQHSKHYKSNHLSTSTHQYSLFDDEDNDSVYENSSNCLISKQSSQFWILFFSYLFIAILFPYLL